MRCLGLLDKLRALAKQAATSFRSLTYDGKVVLDRNLRVYEELYGAPWLYVGVPLTVVVVVVIISLLQ